MEQFSSDGQSRRREYSKALKAQVGAQCGQAGASIGGAAFAHGLHSNMVNRWTREARRDQKWLRLPEQFYPKR